MALTSLTSLTSPFAKVEFNIYLRLFVSYYSFKYVQESLLLSNRLQS